MVQRSGLLLSCLNWKKILLCMPQKRRLYVATLLKGSSVGVFPLPGFDLVTGKNSAGIAKNYAKIFPKRYGIQARSMMH